VNFEKIEAIISEAKADVIPRHLRARQLAGDGLNQYYNFFRHLAMSENRPGVILEIGCYRGTTAAHILDSSTIGFHDHIVIGIDVNPIPYSHSSFIALQGDSCDPKIAACVKSIADEMGGLFAVFQDSSHHYAPSVKEWELYSPMVRPGGIWVSDDITPAFRLPEEPKGMIDYWAEISVSQERKCLYNHLHHGSTVGIALL